MTDSVPTIPLQHIREAHARIASGVVRTPLVPLAVDAGPIRIYLKLENLQPIGSFKLRGATNALRALGRARLMDGVITASAGNMAQGVAFGARELGIPCTVVVPDTAPATKLAAITRLGGSIVKLPFDRWWQVLHEGRFDEVPGTFVHPFGDPAVIAGNGTIGLEILEDLPEVDIALVPFGGGGLIAGIGCAIKSIRPTGRVLACEVATAAPLSASWRAGHPVECSYTPSFVDGISARNLVPHMWPLVKSVVDGVVVVELAHVANAIRVLFERARVVAEGAGAAALAAALSGRLHEHEIIRASSPATGFDGNDVTQPGRILNVVCIVSGGNIDTDKLMRILEGKLP